MANLEQIQMLMAELGPSSDGIAAVLQNEDDQWSIVVDETTMVTVDYDAEEDKLLLSIDLGLPAQESRLEVYETLLSYSLLWRDHGGVHAALGGPGGPLYLLYEFGGKELSLIELIRVLDNFVEAALVWRDYVVGLGDAPTVTDDPQTLGVRV